ncbi:MULTISPECIES: DUF4468 domain-containing protein [Muribaculaceae]|uniref:DUF4468 domain-containing protein n=1 Tax=Muribaculaceae TaxID=2005473 RepID=UPI0025B758DD|nr:MULTISPECIES: DUF4468 domain-containing protein [Muribaculaceae]
MKKIILLLALLVSLAATAQEKALTFFDVIQVEGKNQAEIYGGLREWVATSFVNGKAVTQMEDAATGTIILRALFPFKKGGVYCAYEGKVDYTLKLQSKDGRFRVEMSSITHENKPGRAADCSLGLITTAEKSGKGGINKSAHNKIWKEIKAKSAEYFSEITLSLKKLDNFSSQPEEDW